MARTQQDEVLDKLYRIKDDHRSNLLIRTESKDIVGKILDQIENDDIKLKVNDIWSDEKLDNDDIKAQATVRNRGQNWISDLRADLSLIDKKSGKELDRVKGIKIASLPKMTDRATYLIGGNEYQFAKQARLKPGVYTRIQNDGAISSFFNVDKTIDFERGFNNNFKIDFDPEKKAFAMQYGTRHVPLLNVLRAVGVTDKEIQSHWGKEVYDANAKFYGNKDEQNQRKMYDVVFGKKPEPTMTGQDIANAVRDRLFATKLDPETTEFTLGKQITEVNKEALLLASKKIIGVNKGEVEPDDRDSLIFKSFHDVEDHIRERLIKNSGKIISNIKYKLGKTRNINKSISSQMFDPSTIGSITMSQLSNPPSQTNLMSVVGENTKITVMGEGGIGSSNQITDDARKISNSEAGFIDPLHTPEGGAVGVTVHHTMGTVKVGNDLYGQFIDKEGDSRYLRPAESAKATVSFPDEWERIPGKPPKPKHATVKAIRNNKMITVNPGEVDYIIKSHVNLFDTSSNMIPFLDSIQGNRGLTAAKMQEQALSLKHREEPLFDVVADNKGEVSIGKMIAGTIGTVSSPVNGTVESIGKDEITIYDGKKRHKVQIYNNFPLNTESFIHSDVLVSRGDKVKAGQLLADNNNTKNGRIALGTNLHVAYLPYKGYNFEDSTIVSESAANKLTSEHLYGFSTKKSSKGVFSKNKFKAYYPEDLPKTNMDKLDNDGVVTVGQQIDPGEVIIAHMEKRVPTADDLALGRLDKQLKKDYSNTAVKWDGTHRGMVTSVEKHGNRVTVNVKTEEPLKVADKISGLHGNKHIVSKIVPDTDMPMTADGRRIDITMNPLGVSNRINTSQLREAAAGKIAQKTGKTYIIKNFAETDNAEKIMKDLKDNGLSDKEILIDPESGKPYMNPVMTGMAHIMKLEHKVDHKFSARYREGYDSVEQPVTGGSTGAKNLGRMEVGTLLARNANANLGEMFNIKGQRNDEFWRALETGQALPPPKKPFAWEKMEGMMRGAGININQEGKRFQMKPMTDKDILKLSSGEIEDPTMTYRKKDLAPMKEGLFDPIKSGGMMGDRYTHFKLPEKVLNPITTKAVATILDTTEDDVEKIIEGKQFVDPKTKNVVPKGTPGAISGSPAIYSMVKDVDVKSMLKTTIEEAKGAKDQAKLNKLHKKARYLKFLNDQNMHPTDYFIQNTLVVPPRYRPMFTMGNEGVVIMSDANDLYQQLGHTTKTMKELSGQVKSVSGGNKDAENIMLAEIRGSLYNDVKALAGLREPTSYLHRIKDKKGFIMQIDGGKKQTKEGFYQSTVVNRPQDVVGRSTITLNPNLGGDQIGLPREMAAKIFQPFVMKEMVGLGYSPMEASKNAKDNTPLYNKVLDQVADKRLVIANRAPSLHRWNMTAFRPILTSGKSIEMPGLVVTKNFGGDFDGDAFQIHTPITEKALKEAYTMLPSADSIKTGYGNYLNAPTLDITVGAWLASKGKGGKVGGSYKTLEDARAAYNKGNIDYSDMITINGVKATYAHHEINDTVPEDMRDYKIELSKNGADKWLTEITKKHDGKVAMSVADKIKDVGNAYVTRYGYTLGVSDTLSRKSIRDPEMRIADRLIGTGKDRGPSMVEEYTNAGKRIEKKLTEDLGEDSPLGISIQSGGGKDIGNTAQIISSPMIVSDVDGRPIPFAIKHSYSEGLNTSEYWAAAHGARGGSISKSVSTYKPGWINAELINTMYNTRVRHDDAVDDEGVEMKTTDSRHVMNRYLARTVKDSRGEIIAKRNEPVDSNLLNKLTKKGIGTIYVQSPLTDPTPGDGISSWSYGITEKGQRPQIGSNIGIISSQTVTEPAVNLALKAFHTGGAFGKRISPIDTLANTLRLNKSIPNKATFASVNGVVRDVKKSPIGGWDVTIFDGKENIERYVDPANRVMVSAGDKVKAGDVIDNAPIDRISAHDVLKYRGMPEAQKHIVDQLDMIHEGKLERRHLELLTRSLTNTTRVKDGGSSTYVPGDVAPLTTVNWLNKRLIREDDVEAAKGAKLNKDYGGFKRGRLLDDDAIKHLVNKGFKRVEVEHRPIAHEPMLMAGGISTKASADEDWISRLSHNRIMEVMKEGATQGWSSSADGSLHPLPQLSTGFNYGRQ